MAKVKTNTLIDAISGRVQSDDRVYYSTNSKTGRVHASHYPLHQRSVTDRQRAYFASFGARSRAVSQWYRANQPSPAQPLGSPRFQQLREAFDAQHANGNFYSFVLQQMGEELMEQGI